MHTTHIYCYLEYRVIHSDPQQRRQSKAKATRIQLRTLLRVSTIYTIFSPPSSGRSSPRSICTCRRWVGSERWSTQRKGQRSVCKKRCDKHNRCKSIIETQFFAYLSVGENCGNVEASRALNIHEEAVRGLNQSLELVLALLVSERWVAKVLGHFRSVASQEGICQQSCMVNHSRRERQNQAEPLTSG